MSKLWNRLWKQPAPVAVSPPPAAPPTLDEAKKQLIRFDARLVDRHLTFAQSLLQAVGENPATPEGEVLAHQMAAEQIMLGLTWDYR
jgi:hypothetical protein